MKTLTDEEMLNEIKNRLGITGSYQNATLNAYIEDTKSYLLSAGVPESVVNSSASVGVIARGVSDLWYGSSGFSEYFYQRALQLKYEGGE